MSDDTRDRVIALEVQVRNLDADIGEMKSKVDDMHALLMQAKGARYVIAGAAALAGAVAGFLVKIIPWAGNLPR
jgi:hypothetical protein